MSARSPRPSVAELRAATQPPSIFARNSGEHWAGKLYMRRVSPRLTRVLLATRLSPNTVTALMVPVGLGAAGLLSVPGVVAAAGALALAACSDAPTEPTTPTAVLPTAPALAKAAGLYMICTISKHKAERKGYADALMLDWQGRVAECTGANVFFIKDGMIHTPIADCFLAGITRQTVIDLARRRGFEVQERRILPDELASFNECFITGTAAEVTPVSEIGPYRFQPGNMTKVLMEDYTAEVQPKAKAA